MNPGFRVHQFIIGVVKGIATGASVTALLWIFDVQVGLFTYMLLVAAAATLTSAVFTYHARRQWLQVVEAYHRPAFGEGVDTPGRPPQDDE